MSVPFMTLSADHLKDSSSGYYCMATYSQPIENSSTAACFSGNVWQKAIALSLFVVNKQQGLEYSGEDTLTLRAAILRTPKHVCKKGFQYLQFSNCRTNYIRKMADIN